MPRLLTAHPSQPGIRHFTSIPTHTYARTCDSRPHSGHVHTTSSDIRPHKDDAEWHPKAGHKEATVSNCATASTLPACAPPPSFAALQWFLDEIRKEPMVELVGVHSHLGSTITKVRCAVM